MVYLYNCIYVLLCEVLHVLASLINNKQLISVNDGTVPLIWKSGSMQLKSSLAAV